MPGPTNYADINNFGKNVPTYSILGKREPLKKDSVPGPGAYNANDSINRDKSPTFRMGSA